MKSSEEFLISNDISGEESIAIVKKSTSIFYGFRFYITPTF